MQKVIIVGAGPAGLLLAHYLLARKRYQVEIYERRPDPQRVELSSQRTFPLSLHMRGLNAIRTIPGLEAALVKEGVWSGATLLHGKQGKARRIDRKLPLLLIDRNQLIRVLIQQLLKHYGEEALTIQFDCTCTDVDPDRRTVTLHEAEGEPFTASFDYLVGADGVRSPVRDALVARTAMQCEQSTVPDVYKSLFVRRVSPDHSSELAADCIHSWTIGRNMRVLMAPLPGDWLHGVMIFPHNKNPLEGLTSADAVRDFFQEKCPALAPLMMVEDAEALRLRPISKILTVTCDRMHVGDRILLIGDAIHAVSPSVGQGCNASLQDAQVFAQLLDQYQDDWSRALPEFTAQRLPEAHALRALSDYTFPRSKTMVLEFIFRLIVVKKLRRWFPQLGKPLPMELIMETELPYTQVLHQTQGWIDRVRQSILVQGLEPSTQAERMSSYPSSTSPRLGNDNAANS
ncbi:FAD-dependent oxidoreductase [Vacuolonema iberomarrocanum]|uniref:FAD-dependent oxidoreductase n=1 Tax=Vacuolonema iberomarrocanum TaxID=3454632 RepID=UPI0019FE37E0|nr:FAD-dependent monooxygenase [filamentous cyanobacterium LEGE 07170]